MEFFIRQHSNQPTLRLELIRDGKFNFENFYEDIQNASILFTMKRVDDNEIIISKKIASVELVENTPNDMEEYYITYHFTSRDTRKNGKFEGIFYITFLESGETLIMPIKEKLYINII